MKVSLLGLEFANDNLGCQALTYSFINIFEKNADECKKKIDYIAIVYNIFDKKNVPFNKDIDCLKVQLKKLSFWRSLWKSFRDSDIIVDFTGGDSFSDIYGKKRFWVGTVIKLIAIISGTPLMLGPQTYGPFSSKLCEKISGFIIKRSKWVFARDHISQKCAEDISGNSVRLTTDVAFSLPYSPKKIDDEKKKLGINVSGLLWRGGYANAPINLKVDYREFLRTILTKIDFDEWNVFLIPHVGVKVGSGEESDISACLLLKEEFSQVLVVDDIETPIDAKNIISSMDVFIGARMHATIAAFSSGVATIPFSYSEKFEGLYGNLDYRYIVSARTETTEVAVEHTLDWINNYSILQEAAVEASNHIQKLQGDFNDAIKDILCNLNLN